MRNGVLRLLRGLAIFGMAMATFDFALGVIDWAAPSGGHWFGKRMKDAIEPPSLPGRPPSGPDAGELQRHFRGEVRGLYQRVRESSEWFCLAGIMYLLARRQLHAEAPAGADDR